MSYRCCPKVNSGSGLNKGGSSIFRMGHDDSPVRLAYDLFWPIVGLIKPYLQVLILFYCIKKKWLLVGTGTTRQHEDLGRYTSLGKVTEYDVPLF